MNTTSINALVEELKNSSKISVEHDGSVFLIFTTTSSYLNEKKLSIGVPVMLVDSPVKIEGYVKELNPLVYDLVEYSERPLILELPGATNLPAQVLSPDGSIRVRVVRDGIMQQVLRKYRGPIFMIESNEQEESNTVYELIEEDVFLAHSEIRLAPNGKVQVLKN